MQDRDLAALARLWTAGADVPWEELEPHGAGRLVDLPHYPFRSDEYWLEASGDSRRSPTTGEEPRSEPSAGEPRSDTPAGEPRGEPTTGENRPVAQTAGPSREQVEQVVARILARELHLTPTQMELPRTLGELGADSVIVKKVLWELESVFGFRAPAGALRADVMLPDLVSQVCRQAGQPDPADDAGAPRVAAPKDRPSHDLERVVLERFRSGTLSVEQVYGVLEEGVLP